MTFTTELMRDEEPVTVQVTGRYYRPSSGMRDSLGRVRGAGPPLEPDEPADFEIESLDPDLELTEEEADHIIEEAIDHAQNREPY